MKKNIKSIYLLEILILVFIISYILITKYIQLNRYMLKVGFSILTFIAFVIRFGIKKDKHILKKYTVLLVLINLAVTLIIIYILGLLLGYNRSLFSLNIINMFNGFVPTVIEVICLEIVRFIVCKNSFENKKPIVFYTLLMVIFSAVMQFPRSTLSGYVVFEYICSVILSDIAKESLCSYITYNISFVPSLIYNLLLSIYPYILPIVPTLNAFIDSIIHIVLPFSIYNSTRKMVEDYERKRTITKSKIDKFIFLPIYVFIILAIVLVSGISKYKIIAIASNSMQPTFSKGDSIIYEKISTEEINIGEVLVFIYEGKTVTHRVTKIYKTKDDTVFATKGDSNAVEDKDLVHSKDVLGRAKFVVKWIGYPAVFLNEFLEKE